MNMSAAIEQTPSLNIILDLLLSRLSIHSVGALNNVKVLFGKRISDGIETFTKKAVPELSEIQIVLKLVIEYIIQGEINAINGIPYNSRLINFFLSNITIKIEEINTITIASKRVLTAHPVKTPKII